ncbi:uncharacterized protein EI97DRAFT_251430 [Westerdykella ornata]|uniref:Uncharacterized protein n=1 Tax=Westerdykella ornata TaxID=318751 RepID=A0A6A6JQ31_WESOR|nr:uncharacterized protein EI97DRAFT_251430 [Westerdykella ornata]KAF2278365.1 hypothetical protein EI97DRAFT_251430 [Westerdykella ornata]
MRVSAPGTCFLRRVLVLVTRKQQCSFMRFMNSRHANSTLREVELILLLEVNVVCIGLDGSGYYYIERSICYAPRIRTIKCKHAFATCSGGPEYRNSAVAATRHCEGAAYAQSCRVTATLTNGPASCTASKDDVYADLCMTNHSTAMKRRPSAASLSIASALYPIRVAGRSSGLEIVICTGGWVVQLE